ncbi:enoyl-CoA hydratase/isomerase family protein [Nocardia beijingensis]
MWLLQLLRPKAINALDHSMALTITEREWAEDDPVRTVVVTGAGR